MALFWQVVTLLSVWLLYGFAASLFVKGSNKRDYLLLISSGLLGGLIGGRIGNILDVPENITSSINLLLAPIRLTGFAALSVETQKKCFGGVSFRKLRSNNRLFLH